MLVKFASICDAPRSPELGFTYRGELGGRCAKRSREYTEWPECRVCLEHVCPEHQRSGTYRENDGHESCVCSGCELDEE